MNKNSLSKIISIMGMLIIFMGIYSCDKGFVEMNKNPNAYTEPVLESLFSKAVIQHASSGDQISDPDLMEAGAFVQYLASLTLSEFYGDKYLWLPGNYERYWNQVYSNELRETQQIISLTEDDPELINYNCIARIWRVEVLHRTTDLYGDVPYFEAGKGYIDGAYHPKYDKQEDIYLDMLNELDKAADAFDKSKPTMGGGDFLYQGNIDKWKKFANSLMLRLGMRMTKVDATLAKNWAIKAINKGVMESNEDIARLPHTSGSSINWNVNSWYLQTKFIAVTNEGHTSVKLNKTLIDYMKETEDPRISFYGTLWQGNADKSKLESYSGRDIQQGLPGGQDANSIKEIVSNWNDNSITEYSEWNIHTIAHYDAPTVFLSYAEVEYLLAEATLRGWNPGGGTTKEHYERGVIGHFQMQDLYPNGLSNSQASDSAHIYLDKNPYNDGASFEDQMRQIHTQFWVSQFMLSNVEAYSNWRRTGYPDLIPYNYPGNATGGQIPRRIRYSQGDQSVNTENYNEAVSRQGPDNFNTRIWWDKE